MYLRSAIGLAAAFTLASTWFAIDCARACLLGGRGMSRMCWLAMHTGLTCDTGMLITLLLCAMVGAFATILLWLQRVARG